MKYKPGLRYKNVTLCVKGSKYILGTIIISMVNFRFIILN